MKGKQAILRYLETHRTFTAKDVTTECGMNINCITKNAIDLERARKIVRVSKVWRTVTYRLATAPFSRSACKSKSLSALAVKRYCSLINISFIMQGVLISS